MSDERETNLVQWIEEAANGEAVESVVIGRYEGYSWKSGEDDKNDNVPTGKVLSWAAAAAILNYDFCDGYGGADCHPIYAWTKSRVIFISEYDGSTRINYVPRDPEAGEPAFA